MGILAARRLRQTADNVSAALSDPSNLPYASPWSDGDLAPVLFEDFLHHERPIGTREQAMRLAPVARARNLMVSLAARCPLRAYDGDALLDAQPGFLIQTGTLTSWQHRNAWTVDDLIFHGISCWSIDGAETADRIDISRWRINPDNRVEVDGIVQPNDKVKLIYGFHEGILRFGVEVLSDARKLARTVAERIENPVPAIDLHQTGGTPLTPDERRELVKSWREARRGAGGAAVGYTSETIEVNELGAGGGNDLLIEQRNASAVDQARIIGVAASRIDATADKASLNYETTSGRNGELVDFDLALYLTPFAASLSGDDMVAPGVRVAADYSEVTGLQSASTGPVVGD